MDILLTAPSSVVGTVVVPPSKSISARALILEALAAQGRADTAIGRSLISYLSDCDDTQALRNALTTYRNALKANGNALNTSCEAAFAPSAAASAAPSAIGSPLRIDVGAAGTAMRFLTAYFAVQEGSDVELTGCERMKERPIGPLVDALRQLGADIEYVGRAGFPPIRIHGRRLQGDGVTIHGDVSSQFVSAVLMIAPYVESSRDRFTITLVPPVSSRPYIDMTRDIMSRYGIDADWSDDSTLVVESGGYSPCRFRVDADWSSASYWYSILVACQFLAIPHDYHLASMPAKGSVTQADSRITDCIGLLEDSTHFHRCDFSQMPDLVQTVAVLFCLVRASFIFTGVGNLRLKETDRLSALCEELQKFGYHLETSDDNGGTLIWDGGFGVSSPFVYDDVRWKQTLRLDPHGDHRMAMAFVPMAMRDGHLIVTHAEVVNKSYPTFWDDLRRLGFGVEEIENE